MVERKAQQEACPLTGERRNPGEQKRAMDRMELALEFLQKSVEKLEERTEQIHTEIVGNGKRGLKERVNILESHDRDQEKTATERSDLARTQLYRLIGYIIAAVGLGIGIGSQIG